MGETRLADLIRQLYQIHPAGGPLHAELDDGNLDGEVTPWWDAWTADELDVIWYEGWPLADLPPQAPAVVEGCGASTRQLCEEIASTLNAMRVEQRVALYERDWGP